jgi:hypothetical protein
MRHILTEHIESREDAKGVETAHCGDGFLDGLTGDKAFGDKEQQLIEHERVSGSGVPR